MNESSMDKDVTQSSSTTIPKRSFEKCNESFYINLEESRQILQRISNVDLKEEEVCLVFQLHDNIIENLLVDVNELQSFITQPEEDEILKILIENSQEKLTQFLKSILSTIIEKCIDDETSMDCQACIATLFEMTLDFSLQFKAESESISKIYSNYQVKVLKQRIKPKIAELVQYRASSNVNKKDSSIHVDTITYVLGEASKLIHPLSSWSTPKTELNLMIETAIMQLNQETNTITVRILSWFEADTQIQSYWLDHVLKHQLSTDVDLQELENLLEQIAFLCQIISRYHSLLSASDSAAVASSSQASSAQSSSSKHENLLSQNQAELSHQYSTLEQYYMTLSFQSATTLNTAVEVSNLIHVPSIVEDAFYLSKRSLMRANTTMESQVMVHICHACVEMWNCHNSHSVAYVLLNSNYQQELQDDEIVSQTTPLESSSFATALLDAIDDDDINTSTHSTQQRSSSITNYSQSRQESILFSKLCTLNGLANASTACLAMANLLESIHISDLSSQHMIQCSMEELQNHGYQILLKQHVTMLIQEYFMPTSFRTMQDYLETHVAYDITQQELTEFELMIPQVFEHTIQDNLIFQKLKLCDVAVATQIIQEISINVASLFESITIHQESINEWGSILISKQVRNCMDVLSSIFQSHQQQQQQQQLHHHQSQNQAYAKQSNNNLIQQVFSKLQIIIVILQLEKPSDWITLRYCDEISFDQDEKNKVYMSKDDIYSIMKLRKDFSNDAIRKACFN